MNKLIDLFVKANATQALRHHLLLSTNQTQKILNACSPVEMVMLNANLPRMKTLLIDDCARNHFDIDAYQTQIDCIYHESFSTLPKSEPFTAEFRYYYDIQLKSVIEPHLLKLIEALLIFKNDLGMAPSDTFFLLRETTDETDQQNIILSAGKFARIAKHEMLTAALSASPEDINYVVDLHSISRRFHNFSTTSQMRFINQRLVGEMVIAARFLEKYLQLDYFERYNVMIQLTIASLNVMEDNILQCLNNAFYEMQTVDGRSAPTLKKQLSAHFLGNLPMHFINNPTALEVADTIFNDRLVESLLQLPHTTAVNGTRRLNNRLIQQNVDALRNTFFEIQEVGALTHNVTLAGLPELPAHVPQPSIDTVLVPAAIGGCLCIASLAAYRAYTLFRRKPAPANEELLEEARPTRKKDKAC